MTPVTLDAEIDPEKVVAVIVPDEVTLDALKAPTETAPAASLFTIVLAVLELVAAVTEVTVVAMFAALAPPTVATVAATEPGPVAVTSPVRAVI